MGISKELRKMIEDRLGTPIKYSSDCEILMQAIEDATGERLGLTTVKRLFGFTGDKQGNPRGSTMDILAQFLGYADLKDMVRRLGDASDISMFEPVDEIVAEDLEDGTQIQITYDPGRLLVLTYIGGCRFIVNESQRSKLQKGDKIRVTHFTKGFEMIASEVIRDGENLGSYTAAKDGGLTSLEVII